MGPSDSLTPVGLGYGLPLPLAYLSGRALSLGSMTPAPAYASPSGLLTGSPSRRTSRRRSEGLPGYRTVLFIRAVLSNPAGCAGCQPTSITTSAVAFSRTSSLDTRNVTVFVANYTRPTCSLAYASPMPLPSPSPGWLPVGRARPSPDGFCTHRTANEVSWTHRIPPFLFDQHCLVALVLRFTTAPAPKLSG